MQLNFTPSRPFTIGVELELQIVNTRDYNLSRGAADLLARLEKIKLPGAVKPEIAESMIELNTSVSDNYTDLRLELVEMRDAVVKQAELLNLAIAGGGTHPFQKWSEQRIYPSQRFKHISDLYGYLAKQFIVFGQHIHVGCTSGDEAIYLTHALARYIPHFIALSASSPFFQGVDTGFDSARLNAVNAFPLSGCMPFVDSWENFNDYFAMMHRFNIVASMKDFYWDIRPKPEYGTVEIRVCDTPLTVEHAARLAAYAQTLAHALIRERRQPTKDIYQLYSYNRFQACRFGLHGYVVDPDEKNHITIKEDISRTLAYIASDADILDSRTALDELKQNVDNTRNDTTWVREQYQTSESLSDVVRAQSNRWKGDG